MTHPFLSDEWIAAARQLRSEHAAQRDVVGDGDADGIVPVKLNLTITEVPFGDGTVESYIDTSSGVAEMELGSLDDPDVAMTTDYETAKTIFVVQDPAAGMQAFIGGKVVVQGDMMKLIALNASLTAAPGAAELAAAIQELTA